MADRAARQVHALRARLLALAALLVPITLVSLAALGSEPSITRLALVPREPSALTGVLTMPLVHGSLAHLGLNLGALTAFASLVLLRGPRYLLLATLLVLLPGGALLWLTGRDGAHIGASLLVFGYFGLLVTRGFLERQVPSLLLSVAVLALYGGILRGVIPAADGVSWEGHLCGLLSGLLAARLLLKRNRV